MDAPPFDMVLNDEKTNVNMEADLTAKTPTLPPKTLEITIHAIAAPSVFLTNWMANAATAMLPIASPARQLGEATSTTLLIILKRVSMPTFETHERWFGLIWFITSQDRMRIKLGLANQFDNIVPHATASTTVVPPLPPSPRMLPTICTKATLDNNQQSLKSATSSPTPSLEM